MALGNDAISEVQHWSLLLSVWRLSSGSNQINLMRESTQKFQFLFYLHVFPLVTNLHIMLS